MKRIMIIVIASMMVGFGAYEAGYTGAEYFIGPVVAAPVHEGPSWA